MNRITDVIRRQIASENDSKKTEYAKLIAGITSEVVVLYLAAIGEKAELMVV